MELIVTLIILGLIDMPRGTPAVYLGQEGTGAAQVLGKSSFDPVAMQKGALNFEAAKQKQGQVAKQNQLNALYKSTIRGDKLIDSDMFNLISYRDNKMIDDAITMHQDNNGLDGASTLKLQGFQTETAGISKTAAYQKDTYDKYNQVILGDGQGQFNKKAMNNRQRIYLKPDLYEDDPIHGARIKETFTPLLESYMADEDYADNPEAATQMARIHWRQQYGTSLLSPILSPESLTDDFNKKKGSLVNTTVDNQKNGSSQLGEITKVVERSYVDDTDVKLPDGSTIRIPGVKTTARINYDTDGRIKESVQEYFSELPSTTVNQYMTAADNNYDKAALTWYQDEMSKLGQKMDVKEQVKTGTMKSYNIGGRQFNSEFNIEDKEGDILLNAVGIYSKDPDDGGKKINLYRQAKFHGFTVLDDKGKPPRLFVNPTEVYDQDLTSMYGSKVGTAGNYYFDPGTTMVLPVLSKDINLNDPQYEGFKSAWINKYGDSKESDAVGTLVRTGGVIKAGTPISDTEANLLDQIFIHKGLVSNRAFMGGSLMATTSQLDNKGQVKDKKDIIPGALIPLDQVNEEFYNKTQIDPQAVTEGKGLYTVAGRRQYGTPQEKQKTPDGVEFDGENDIGYYVIDNNGNHQIVKYKD